MPLAVVPGDSEEAALAHRRYRRLIQELIVRGAVALAILAFDVSLDLWTTGGGNRLVRLGAVVGLLANGVYYVAARTLPGRRAQAYVRMVIDVELITLGLYGIGGLAAAPYLAVYAVVPVYAGLVFSSAACLLATALAAASYVGVALLSPPTSVNMALGGGAWGIAAFNLLIVWIVGVLTAVLAEAYRRSRLRLAALNRDLERANEESLRLNTELQRTARLSLLGEGIAGIAHELNNVVNIVLGHVSIVHQRAAELPPAVARHLAQALEACDNAARILRNTLGTVREGSVDKTVLSLADVARRTVELKAYDLKRDGITIRIAVPNDLPPVHGVSFQLQQVLLNLITNAQQALRESPPPRAIEVVGARHDGRAVIEVKDNGPGIPPAVLPRLFTPFFTTKAEGTGLGLTVSSAIVRDHGGTLGADNRPGGGAVFRVELPIV